jgi:hypothetical protein
VRIGDRVFDLRVLRERDFCLNLPSIGVKYIAEAARRAWNRFSSDKMADLTHGPNSLIFLIIPGMARLTFSAGLRRFLQHFADGSRPSRPFQGVIFSPTVSLYPPLTAPV